MGLTVKDSGGGDFELVPEGTHLGICCQIIDLGTQTTTWQGAEKQTPKISICWELPTCLDKDGRQFIWNRYTASLGSKANLRHDLETWRGQAFTAAELEGFSVKKVIGAYCLLAVTHGFGNDGVTKYANVDAVMKLPKGMEKPAPEHDVLIFDINEWDQNAFDSMSEGLQKTINASAERRAFLEQAAQTPGGAAGKSIADEAAAHAAGAAEGPKPGHVAIDEDEIPF